MAIEEARVCFKRGWNVIPLKKNTKVPSINIRNYLKERPTNEELGSFDWSGNYGIICGEVSGICVLDVDSPKGDFTLADRDININDYLTATVSTPNGMHYYFKYNNRIRTGVAVIGDGIDVRSDGGYVVGPGSEIDGKQYEWVPDFSPEAVGIADAPEWMFARKENAVKKEVWLDEPIRNGRRNNTFTSLAGALVYRNLSWRQILDVLIYFNDRWCDEPLEIGELENIVNSVERYRTDDN